MTEVVTGIGARPERTEKREEESLGMVQFQGDFLLSHFCTERAQERYEYPSIPWESQEGKPLVPSSSSIVFSFFFR
jgi:hypothetical protein